MMTNSKEVYKEFNLAKKHFKKAIELAKSNLIIGEVTFPTGKKLPRKVKIIREQPAPTEE